jgi:hypothetical protein
MHSLFKSLSFIIPLTLILTHPASIKAENTAESTVRSGIGLRPLGMGGAFVGVADTVHAAYWNPAGLGDLVGIHLSLERLGVEDIREPLTGDFFKRSSGSISLFSIGYSWWNLRGDHNDLGLEGLQVHLIGLGLATEMGFNAGASFKLLTHKDSIGWGLDLGALAHISPLASWGISVQNLFEPEVSDGIKVGPTTKTGFAFYPLAEKYPELAEDLVVAVDADIGRDGGILFRYGLEGKFWDGFFALRGGYDGYRPSFGASVGSPILTVDYLGRLMNSRLENSLGLSFSLGLGLTEKKYLSEYDFSPQDSSGE